MPFADEPRDLQMALATRVAGRLSHAPDSSRGGFVDLLEFFHRWDADYVIGQIEPEPGRTIAPDAGELRVLMMSGRRVSPLAEGRSGLLTGWHDRARAARIEGPGPVGTLVSMGICELLGVIRGERFAFLELMDAIKGPAQVVYTSDTPLVHSARIVAEQIRRIPAEREAIARDLAAGLAGGPIMPTPADWVFAGAMLNALGRSPVTETYQVIARDGLRNAGPADAIVLSAHSESSTIFRHRRLGYSLYSHDFRLGDAGPAYVGWLRAQFEPVRRTLDDIRADYDILIDLIRERAPATQILICNIMSSSGADDVQSYAAFDAPLGETLSSVHAKDINLMLCDLARERDIAVVDADAIAAELGGQRNVPDGVHQNGAMQAETRAEILRILRARGVPGFEPAG
jgi:hypothetical protein